LNVKLLGIIQQPFFKPALGAVLAILCGLALWSMPLGDGWVNASYDYLFRFSARPVTNDVVLVLMDKAAHAEFRQERGVHWARARHTQLLEKLAADGCPLVVFDVFFGDATNAIIDNALAAAMRTNSGVVLRAEKVNAKDPDFLHTQPTLPAEPFLSAAGLTNWGVAEVMDPSSIVRQHPPFSWSDHLPSLPRTAARVQGAPLADRPQAGWIRYYGESSNQVAMSYHRALEKPAGYFRGKTVFIGSAPETPQPNDGEKDEFSTPRTRWTRESVGGVEILATQFLNLLNGDWLRRPAPWAEALILIVFGGFLGGGLCRVPRLVATGIAAGVALTVTLGAVLWSYYTNHWFPWLVIAGGQVPCALIWALIPVAAAAKNQALEETVIIPVEEIPGGFGMVWRAQSAIGQWQALKKVYRSKFKGDRGYEMEFEGVKKYKPVSEQHPALLRVEFINRVVSEGFFYYVMELGDAMEPGWEANPTLYKPRTLSSVRLQHPGSRMPVRDCAQIGIVLAEALDYLHSHELTHRDVKPSNVIFVKGRPKLADVGLVTEARLPGEEASRAGTLDYMPRPGETQGTKQADIYALGMLLYVISSGSEPVHFPDLPTILLEQAGHEEFRRLDVVILKACQPDCALRYASAADLRSDLLNLQEWLGARAAGDQQ
jgi:CHASE2 domain-containing sensor protein